MERGRLGPHCLRVGLALGAADPVWLVQVSRREAKKLSAALEMHEKLCHVNASEMHHAFPSLSPL